MGTDIQSLCERALERSVRIRHARGMSQTDLATAMRAAGVNISRSRIANIETGRRQCLHLDEALAMAEALGVDLQALLSDDPVKVEFVLTD